MTTEVRFLAEDVNSSDLEALDDFVNSDRPLNGEAEAIRLLCIARAVVARSGATPFPAEPDDCWCGSGPKIYWQNAGHALRFMLRATHRALEEYIAAERAAAAVRAESGVG